MSTPRNIAVKTEPVEPAFRGYRRLAWNEVVYHGDFVADEHMELKPWEGLSGFRAGSFVQSIYRKEGAASMDRPATSHRSHSLKIS